MEIVINKYGSSLQKSGKLFKIFSDGNETKISPKRVSSVVISNGVSVSSDAVMMALRNNIEIYILDKYGNPIGRFWHARMGSTVKIRRAQLLSSTDANGLKFGLKWINGKFENQIKFLKNMQNRRTRLSSEIQEAVESISETQEKINKLEGNIDEIRNTILGLEGSAGRVYWNIYGKFMSGGFEFKGRTFRPAEDEINAIINYGFGFLYRIVEKGIILSGLDPYIGFIHSDNYNKISLVFDVIEKYRIWVEDCIISMLSKKSLKKSYFEKWSNGYYLNDEGKKIFIPIFNEYLDKTILHKNRNIQRRNVIQLELHSFAKELLKEYYEK